MAIAIDPACPSFVESTVLPSGRFGGRSLCEVGSTLDGLTYLCEVAGTLVPPAEFMGGHFRRMIEQFLSRPDRRAVLDVASRKKQRR